MKIGSSEMFPMDFFLESILDNAIEAFKNKAHGSAKDADFRKALQLEMAKEENGLPKRVNPCPRNQAEQPLTTT